MLTIKIQMYQLLEAIVSVPATRLHQVEMYFLDKRLALQSELDSKRSSKGR